MEVNVLDVVKGLPDMVFCANQSLPCLDEEGNKIAVMSRMHAPQRRDEVPIVENWLQSAGYRTLYPDLNADESFEGMRSEEHTSELQSRGHLVCRLLLEKKKNKKEIRVLR